MQILWIIWIPWILGTGIAVKVKKPIVEEWSTPIILYAVEHQHDARDGQKRKMIFPALCVSLSLSVCMPVYKLSASP
jgi:hypothetical protein